MQVRMYTCGPSTYQQAHIGNYRTFLFEDILQRYLEYLGYKVTRVMTLTDVEDKAIAQAKKENLTVEELTTKNEAVFFADFVLLHIKKPDYPIRASSAVDQAVSLISKLLESGYAYFCSHDGAKNVYFDPLKFKGFGKLSRLNMSTWPKKKRRFHKDTYPGTPWNMGDFVIWHGCKDDDVCWNAPIGTGRPAWNIQDAAIVTKTLGYSVDVACGGIDNLVRHHDYTLAVAESVSGKEFSRFWLHGAHLYVNGKKMSKSVGNVYCPNDLVAKGFSGEQIRFFLIYGSYRETLNFTFEGLAESSRKLAALKCMIVDLQKANTTVSSGKAEQLAASLAADFEACMNNDLNIKEAFDQLYATIELLHDLKDQLSMKNKKEILANLTKIDAVLQCIL
jgi:cysteinyl-tRNA synthetase